MLTGKMKILFKNVECLTFDCYGMKTDVIPHLEIATSVLFLQYKRLGVLSSRKDRNMPSFHQLNFVPQDLRVQSCQTSTRKVSNMPPKQKATI